MVIGTTNERTLCYQLGTYSIVNAEHDRSFVRQDGVRWVVKPSRRTGRISIAVNSVNSEVAFTSKHGTQTAGTKEGNAAEATSLDGTLVALTLPIYQGKAYTLVPLGWTLSNDLAPSEESASTSAAVSAKQISLPIIFCRVPLGAELDRKQKLACRPIQ
ncbi:hypothetical protein BKA93DRAFT_572717 [Sparassis latifolia]